MAFWVNNAYFVQVHFCSVFHCSTDDCSRFAFNFHISASSFKWSDLSKASVHLHLHFTFMHLVDAFIQSDLQCIQAIHFYQYVCSLGIEPTTFCAANAMLYHWATGTVHSLATFISWMGEKVSNVNFFFTGPCDKKNVVCNICTA